MNTLAIYPGRDKNGAPEDFAPLLLSPGGLYAIAGNTGSGKSRLIKDIEQLVDGDSVSGRRVQIDSHTVPPAERLSVSAGLVAHLSQNMRFVLDLSVEDFLALHCQCRNRQGLTPETILETANQITPEPIRLDDSLNRLSGGQSRALMISDIALVCDSPVVLIDEIENAGVNKKKALELLIGSRKLVLIVTHDPHTALMAPKRIILRNGAIRAVLDRSKEEEGLFLALDRQYEEQMALQERLRKGVLLT